MNNIEQTIKLMTESNASFFLIEGNVSIIYEAVNSVLSKKYEIDNFENNVDVRIFEAGELSVADVKKIIFEIGLKPYFQKKIIIFKNFERVSEQSQNALLKCLEDLPDDTILFSLCSETIEILDTIKSRAYYQYISGPQKSEELSDGIDLLAASKKTIIEFFNEKMDKEDIIIKLDQLISKNQELIKKSIFENDINQQLIKINDLANECHDYIKSNCNKNLSSDLFLYKILEEK